MSNIILHYQLFIAVSNSDSTSEPHTGAVIGGAVGGAILLLIIFVFCMVVYSVCWSCKKKSYKFTNKELAESGSDIIMGTNPSSDINNQSTKEEYVILILERSLKIRIAMLKLINIVHTVEK